MANIRQETRIELGKRELVTLCGAGPRMLHCEDGELWLTFDGRSEDIFLKAGESLRLDGRPGTVVSALRPSTLTLSGDRQAGACAIAAIQAPWVWARRLRWKFPAAALLPATHLR